MRGYLGSIAAALAIAFLGFYLLLVVIDGPPGDPVTAAVWMLRERMWLIGATGLIAGILFRAAWPRTTVKQRMWLALPLAVASVALGLVLSLAVGMLQSVPFYWRVLRPKFPNLTTEETVRVTLGPPTAAEISPDFKFIGNSLSDCLTGGPASNLIYTGHGSFRILYFDAKGRLVCEGTGGFVSH